MKSTHSDTGDRVRRAMALIDPGPERRARCEGDVIYALRLIDNDTRWVREVYLSRTKRGKLAADRLQKALRRLQIILNDSDLPLHLLNFFPAKDVHGIFAQMPTLRLQYDPFENGIRGMEDLKGRGVHRRGHYLLATHQRAFVGSRRTSSGGVNHKSSSILSQ